MINTRKYHLSRWTMRTITLILLAGCICSFTLLFMKYLEWCPNCRNHHDMKMKKVWAAVTNFQLFRPECLQKRSMFSQRKLPLTALASFPGSGNTWLRHLLQQATGISTGSIYFDMTLKKDGFPAEGSQNRSCIVIKTHSSAMSDIYQYEKAILLTREPVDAALAEFNRRYKGHRGFAPDSAFLEERKILMIHIELRVRDIQHQPRADAGLEVYIEKIPAAAYITGLTPSTGYKYDWQNYTKKQLSAWVQFHKSWLHFPGPLYHIQYEDLRKNTRAVLEGLLLFLDAHLTTDEGLRCALINAEGRFHRRPLTFLQQYNFITPEMVATSTEIKAKFTNSKKALRETPNGGNMKGETP